MLDGHHLADGAAGRMAEHMGAPDLQVIHQGTGIVGHLLDRKVDWIERGGAAAAMIVADRVKCCDSAGTCGSQKAASPPRPVTSMSGGPEPSIR